MTGFDAELGSALPHQLTEAVFPLLGAAFVIVCVLPLSALLTRLIVGLVERQPGVSVFERMNLRYLLLTGSSLLPFAWFASAGAHQAESGQSVLSCLFEHRAAAWCFEPGLFALILGGFLTLRGLSSVRRGRAPELGSGERVERVQQRCLRLLALHPELGVLDGRVGITGVEGFALGTCGWWSPEVYVGADFAEHMTDEMLRAALGHEAEHVRKRDPLRYGLLRFALAANPLGRSLLVRQVEKWCIAREAECDREAVLRGSSPLALAQAIVRAARPAPELVALGAHDAKVLRLRVALLIAFAERRPAPRVRERIETFPMAVALLGLTLALPHHAGTLPLDVLHLGTEHTLSYLLP